MHIRIHGPQKNIDILNIYQHVHSQVNLERRQHIWDRVNDLLTSLPKRNFLLMMGDFNTSLLTRSSAVGLSTFTARGKRLAGTQHSDSDSFHQLLRQHSLLALNTWSSDHGPTYLHPNAQSRIDFLCCRRQHSDWTAKQVQHLPLFPLNLDSETHHLPLMTSVLRCWISTTKPCKGWSHRQRLQLYKHWTQQDDTALSLQHHVQQRLDHLSYGDDPLHETPHNSESISCD